MEENLGKILDGSSVGSLRSPFAKDLRQDEGYLCAAYSHDLMMTDWSHNYFGFDSTLIGACVICCVACFCAHLFQGNFVSCAVPNFCDPAHWSRSQLPHRVRVLPKRNNSVNSI